MNKNVGTVDKWIRVVVALILAWLGYVYSSWILYALAVIALFTAMTGWCWLYSLLGVSTVCKTCQPVQQTVAPATVKAAAPKAAKPKAKKKR